MKPHLDIKHTGTLGTENRRRMTFDENSVAHLMSVLTDMYSDTELAPIREYSTNAWDAHKAAGISDPIEITRPTSLNPIFIVKDHGIGMSEEDVLENFSRYGWSSKRDNDDEVGMLGLGCKSALTYTSQFTMIVTKDCIQVTVLVTRDPDGAGVVQIVDRQPSTDPNGVEVQIPVKHTHSFNNKITHFFEYWDRGTVLIDGEQPEPIWERKTALKISDDVILFSGMRNAMTRDMVVMGNVAYPVDTPHRIVPKMDNVQVILRVPIGAVNFTPSRESLLYSKRTEEVLIGKRDFIMETAMKKAQDDIDAAPTHGEALRRVLKWREAHPYFKYTYKGVEVPVQWEYPIDPDEDTNKPPYGKHIFKWHSSSGLDFTANRTGRLRAEEALNGLHIVGFEGKSLYRGVKQRLRLYFEQNSLDPRMIYFYPKAFMDPWIDGANVVKYETIKAIEIPREQRPAPKRIGYRVLNAHGTDHLVRDVPRNPSPHPIQRSRYDRDPIQGPEEPGALKDLVVLEAGVYTSVDKRRLAGQLLLSAQEAGENVIGVVVTKTEMKKFLKDHPTAVKFAAWLEKRIASYYASVTGLEAAMFKGYSAYNGRPRLWQRLSQIDDLPMGKILDPDLRAVIAKFKTTRDISLDIELFRKASYLYWDAEDYKPKLPGLPASNADQEIEAVLDRYPLCSIRGSGRLYGAADAHFVEYINCVYTRKYRPETRKVTLP